MYVNILGTGLLQLWCQWWHHSVGRIFQTCRNLQNSKTTVALSVNQDQEINKNRTLPHGTSEITISAKTGTLLHAWCYLGLLIQQKLEICETVTLPHGISIVLLFLWTSILLKTSWFMPNSTASNIQEKLEAFSQVKSEIQQNTNGLVIVSGISCTIIRQWEWPLVSTYF